ncbi:transporter substrate-binding domain-containing protein [Mesorhizobium sp. M0488]|uniref:transporter substrate-binding domain-containing protein n=1 Tax=unclassified Mesorhizobium TaxID=325217 RepID=UPI00333A8F10
MIVYFLIYCSYFSRTGPSRCTGRKKNCSPIRFFQRCRVLHRGRSHRPKSVRRQSRESWSSGFQCSRGWIAMRMWSRRERFTVSRKRRTALSLCFYAIPKRKRCALFPGKPFHTLPGIALAGSFVLLLTLVWPQVAAQAQHTSEPLNVGVFVNPPFVMKENGRFTGMAVDLWQDIAPKLGRQYHYIEFQTVHDLVEATASGKVDVAITNLTINRPRAERIDFTQPWFDGGMRIMTGTDQGRGFSNLIAGLSDAGFLAAYGWIALIIMVATVLLTIFDRQFDEAFPKRWRDGIAESFYTVMSVAASGKASSRRNLFGWIGRIWQGLWLICGVAVLAYVTSSVTSVMTTLSLTNRINGIADLTDRTVGVLTGTVEENFARERGLQTQTYPGLDRAVEGLVNGEVTAIIADAPVLEYYAYTHRNLPVRVVGRLFEPDKYGFALPLQSLLARPLTIELLGARDAGEIEALRTKYFGAPH